MNFYFKIGLYALLIVSLSQPLIAQTFSAKFDAIDGRGELGAGIITDEESIYIVSISVCEDGIRWCTPVYCLGHDGETKWSQVIEDFNLSNRDNISLRDNKVYITSDASDNNDETQRIKMVALDSETGDILERLESPLSLDFTHMLSNGHIIVDDLIYVYGSSRLTANTNTVVGSIHIMDFAGEVIESVAIEIAGFNVIYDVAISDDGKYYFILELSDDVTIIEFDPLTYDYKQIWEEQLFNSRPRFTLTDYGFVLAGERGFTINGLYELIGISFTGAELWKQSYLSTGENFDTKNISDLHTTQNGDILMVSMYSIIASDPDKANFNAMIGRHDQWGEALWLKTYPTFADDDIGHAFSGFLGVTEATDGSIIATGYVSNTSIFFDPNFENHTMVVKVGANGCFDSDCDQEDLMEYATSTEDLEDQTSGQFFTITPNPASDYLMLKSDVKLEAYTIANVVGTQLYNGNYVDGDKIDVSQFCTGIYFITASSTDGKSYTDKFIVE